MKWHIETRKVSDLKVDPNNPRVLTEKKLADLKKSVDKFGLAEPIVINTDNMIIGGHGRAKVLEPGAEVEVYVPDRTLTEEEYKELNIRLNKNIAGDWDFDILANQFEVADLLEWGFQKWEFSLDIEKVDVENEWQGMPDFVQTDGELFKLLIVRFLTPEHYEDFNKLIGQKLTEKTKSIWFPERDLDSNNRDKEYAT